MQPLTSKNYTDHALKGLQSKLSLIRSCKNGRESNPSFALHKPIDIGLKLTNRCNLRCSHCFQWDDSGYHRNFSACENEKTGDLDIKIVQEIMAETQLSKSKLFLWGGEPLMYSDWKQLIDILTEDKREVVICTNGMLIEKELASLNKISERLTVLVSVDGLETAHDSIRGKNTFKRIVNNINLLQSCKNDGLFKGQISIAAVLSDEIIPRLFEFCTYFEKMKIDTLYINFPWFIPEKVALEMDQYYSDKFSWLDKGQLHPKSWHSFDFRITPSLVPQLLSQISAIKSKKWQIRLRIQPNLQEHEILDFVNGTTMVPSYRKMCLSISNRLDVMPNGDVVPCKKFPEFAVDNFEGKKFNEVWHGKKFEQFRSQHNNTLMPICSKCELLYSNGV